MKKHRVSHGEPRMKDLMTPIEVQEKLRIGRTTFYRLAKHPTFPTLRIGNRIFVPANELEVWIEKATKR